MEKEQKLAELIDKYEELKESLENLINDYEADYAEDRVMDLFLEASNATNDAIDCLNDIEDL